MSTHDAAEPAPVHEVAAVSTVPAEARPFQGLRAGVVTKTVANVIDVGIVIVVLASSYIGWSALRFLRNPTGFTFPPVPAFGIILLTGMFVLAVYFALSWMTTGRTYGDHVMGLRVVNFRGRRMNFVGAIVRSAFCVVFPIGLYWTAVSPQRRSVQDVVLRTSVIYDWVARDAGASKS